MLHTKQNRFDLAFLCRLSVSQIDNLLYKKHRSMRDETIIRFCQGTGLKFSDIFTVEEVDSENENFFSDAMVAYLEKYQKAILKFYEKQVDE